MEPTMRLDLEDVFDGFDAMRKAGNDLRPVWRSLIEESKRDQKEHARLQEGTEGKWTALAESTRARRARGKRGRGSARRLGKLPTAVRTRFDLTNFKRQSIVDYSGVHQDGGQVGRGSVIPAREHVYFSEEWLRRAIERLAVHIAEAF